MQKTKRKRSYYRALKRGETWALIRQMKLRLTAELIIDMFGVEAVKSETLQMAGLTDILKRPRAKQ